MKKKSVRLYAETNSQHGNATFSHIPVIHKSLSHIRSNLCVMFRAWDSPTVGTVQMQGYCGTVILFRFVSGAGFSLSALRFLCSHAAGEDTIALIVQR